MHSRTRQAPQIGTQTYLEPTQDLDRLLWDLCRLFGRDLRRVYTQIYDHHAQWFIKGGGGLRNQLASEGWLRQEADAMHWKAAADHDSLRESRQLNLQQVGEQIAEARKRLKDKKKKLAGRRKHHLHNKIQRLESRQEQIKQQLEDRSYRVVFGGRKLAKAGNNPQLHGYESREQWRQEYDRARNGYWSCQGNIIATGGNAAAQLILSPDGDKLRLHISRQLGRPEAWVEIPVRRLEYRRAEFSLVATPDQETTDRLRAAWKELPEDKRSKRPPRRRLVIVPVSYQIRWSERKQRWYLDVSWEDTCRPEYEQDSGWRCGVDINPDHLACCVIKPDGNPVAWIKIPCDLDGTHNQVADRVSLAAQQAVWFAKSYNAELVVEELDFTRSRAQLAYMPNHVARLLSSFAYRQVLLSIGRHGRHQAVRVHPVDPAYTSTLGRINFAGVYGVSVDQAAAASIARRGLGLVERARPSVARSLPGCAGAGHAKQIGLLHRRLKYQSRSTTWDKGSGLLRRGLPGYHHRGGSPAAGKVKTAVGSISARVSGPNGQLSLSGRRSGETPDVLRNVLVNNGQHQP